MDKMQLNGCTRVPDDERVWCRKLISALHCAQRPQRNPFHNQIMYLTLCFFDQLMREIEIASFVQWSGPPK